jgi:acyl-coenzyme A synthetase/AMP-(fatty) acid ligase
LASYKVPKQIVVSDELPLTASGKIQKFVLRDHLARGEIRSSP